MPFCAQCGTSYLDGSKFCPGCGRSLKNDDSLVTEKESAVVPASTYKEIPVANAALRFLAGFIDVGVALCLLFPLYRYTKIAFFARKAFLLYLLPGVYLILRDSIKGKSLGKFLTGLVVVNERENRVGGITESVIRNWFLFVIILPPSFWLLNFGLLIFGFLTFIIAVQIFAGTDHRLGEKLACTKVVEQKRIT